LGDGTTTRNGNFTKIIGDENYAVKNIYLGYQNSFIQRKGLKIFSFGKNNVNNSFFFKFKAYQLGISNKITPITSPIELSYQNYDIIQLASGNAWTMILTKSGNVYSIGSNTVCELFLKFRMVIWE
jgi:alpha-tubulin suppressor-like RCC1 family protein